MNPEDVTQRLPHFPGQLAERSAAEGGLGRYEVLDRLGAGGMGEVYLVHDATLERSVAAKVCTESDPVATERFVLEARITGKLEHPSIVPLHDLDLASDGRMFFTMKRVEGADLARRIAKARKGDPPPLVEWLQIFLKICDALAFAHGQRDGRRLRRGPGDGLGPGQAAWLAGRHRERRDALARGTARGRGPANARWFRSERTSESCLWISCQPSCCEH